MGYSEGRVNKHRMVHNLMRISVPLFFTIRRKPLKKASVACTLVLAIAVSLLVGMAGMAAEGRGAAINAQGSAAGMAAAAGSIVKLNVISPDGEEARRGSHLYKTRRARLLHALFSTLRAGSSASMWKPYRLTERRS